MSRHYILIILTILVFTIVYGQKDKGSRKPKSVIDLINKAYNKHQKVKNSLRYNERVCEIRQKVVQLYRIETDTSKINRFIVIDVGNLEGAYFYGEMIRNDTSKY